MEATVESAIVRQAVNWTLTLPQWRPEPIQTRWTLITGVPSSGKSTIINDLSQSGIAVGRETAAEVIERGLKWRSSSGAALSLNDILNTQALQDEIFSTEARRLSSLCPEQSIVLDRSIPDVLIFSALGKLNVDQYLWAARRYRFERVIVLEPLPYVENNIRSWTREQLASLHTTTLEVLKTLGYSAISIPSANREERLEMVKYALEL